MAIQDVFNKTNHIYKIVNDIDLNGGTLNIPEGCTLDFQGGSISNGTIKSAGTNIVAPLTKIFDNVTFRGAIILQTFEVDWFVDEYLTKFQSSNVTIDSSVQLNKMFSCGVKYFHFNFLNKWYYLKNPIVINGDINIVRESTLRLSFTQDRRESSILSCIYSNEIITLIEYNHIATQDSDYFVEDVPYQWQNNFILCGLRLHCNRKYTALDNTDTPILLIKAKRGTAGVVYSVYGAQIDCVITAVECQVNHQVDDVNVKTFVPNYTGIKLVAETNNLTYVRINGSVNKTFYAIQTDRLNGQWITDITFAADTWCVKGGKLNGVNPLKITGSHQTMSYFDSNNKESYFEAETIVLTGWIWDIGTGNASSGYTPYYAVGTLENVVEFNYQNKISDKSNKYLSKVYAHPIDDLNHPNLLFNTYKGLYKNNVGIEVSFKYNGEELEDIKDKILNIDNLFPNRITTAKQTYSSIFAFSDYCLIESSENNCQFEIIIDIPGTALGYYNANPSLFMSSFGQASLEVTNKTTQKVIYSSTITAAEFYYNNVLNIFTFPSSENFQIKIVTDFTKNDAYARVPIVYIPDFTSTTDKIYEVYGAENRPQTHKLNRKNRLIYDSSINKLLIHNFVSQRWETVDGKCAIMDYGSNRPSSLLKQDRGYRFFDTTNNKSIVWEGTKWVDCDGFDAVKTAGLVSQRPILESTNLGFCYYDTTFQKPTYFNGSTWLDANGFTVARNSGGTDQKPTLTGLDVGFQYYNTDEDAVEVWNGEEWHKVGSTETTPTAKSIVLTNPTIGLQITKATRDIFCCEGYILYGNEIKHISEGGGTEGKYEAITNGYGILILDEKNHVNITSNLDKLKEKDVISLGLLYFNETGDITNYSLSIDDKCVHIN